MSASELQSATSMRRRSLFKILALAAAGVVVLLILILIVGGLVAGGTYPTTQAVDRSFVVDVDFTKVRKILVRTDATKQIVTMTGDSQFVDQHWSALGAGLNGILSGDVKWNLELHGTLVVRTRDAYIGEHEIALSQVVKIDPDQIYSDVELDHPTDRLLQYEMTTWFERQSDGMTRVRQHLKQEIVTDAPWFAHFIADRRVRQSAEQALENQETAIRQIIEENRDKRWLLFQ